MDTQKMPPTKQYAEFLTVTCLEWKHILSHDRLKDIIIQSLTFLTSAERISVYALCQIILIWQILGDHKREEVQSDFLKFTGQQILKVLRNEQSTMQDELLVKAKDRKYQVWERNSLGVPLWSDDVMWQKIEYIHYNPVKAGLCEHAEDYKYSSAGFYYKSDKLWDFLIHCDG